MIRRAAALALVSVLAVPLRADPPSGVVVLDQPATVDGVDSVRVIVVDKATKDEYKELLDAVAPGRTVETVDEYAAHADAKAVMDVRAKLYGRRAVVYRYAKKMKSPTPATLRTSTQRDPQQSSQLYLEGVIYYQKGDLAKSRDRWERALALDPGNDDARVGLEKLKTTR